MDSKLFACLLAAAMATAEAPLIDIPHATVAGKVLSGGQPDRAHLEAARDAGFAAVVNLRGADEFDGYDEAAEVEALGMAYHAIPVSSAADVDADNARALKAILEGAGDSPVLVHCASGNRVGALVALGEWLDGADPDAAVAAGRDAGLTRLEDHVRALMNR